MYDKEKELLGIELYWMKFEKVKIIYLSLTCMYKVIYYKQIYNKLIYSIGDFICQVVQK